MNSNDQNIGQIKPSFPSSSEQNPTSNDLYTPGAALAKTASVSSAAFTDAQRQRLLTGLGPSITGPEDSGTESPPIQSPSMELKRGNGINGVNMRVMNSTLTRLPLPPSVLALNKLASTASLPGLNGGVSPSAGKSDRLRPSTPIPSSSQLVRAAHQNFGSMRLPPLRMANRGGTVIDGRSTEWRESTDDALTELSKLGPSPLAVSSLSLSPANNSSTQPDFLNSVNHTNVNEVVPTPVPPTVHKFDPNRRRPSSATLPISRGGPNEVVLGAHKPLPAIAEPHKRSRSAKSDKESDRRPRRSKPWRFFFRCMVVSMFLSIPVIIFVLMMFFSDGFASPSTDVNSTTTVEPSEASTAASNKVNIIISPFNLPSGGDGSAGAAKRDSESVTTEVFEQISKLVSTTISGIQ